MRRARSKLLEPLVPLRGTKPHPPFSFPRKKTGGVTVQKKGVRLAVSGLNKPFASGMRMPARGDAAFSIAIRFASASIIRCRSADLVGVLTNIRLPEHSTMRRAPAMPLFRRQSAAVLTSHAPHDSKARLQSVTTRRRFMAKPCTPHLHCAARAVIQAANCQCWGSRGAPLVLSLGGVRGIFSFEKENIPLSRVPHTVWGIIECALRAQKKKHPFGCSLFIQQ